MIKIDGKDYDADKLSEQASQQLFTIKVALNITQTARHLP